MTAHDSHVTVIIPCFRSSQTIEKCMASLASQVPNDFEVILVDDACPENSGLVGLALLTSRGFPKSQIQLVEHQKNLGLAAALNSGVKHARGGLIVSLHPDMVLPTCSELTKITQHFSDPTIVVVGHTGSLPPREIWSKLGILNRIQLAPYGSKWARGFNTQFDCWRKSLHASGCLFHSDLYLNAGEDGDFLQQALKFGRYHVSDARAEHHHTFSEHNQLHRYFDKSIQYGNAQGAHLRRRNLVGLRGIFSALHRELGIISALIGLIIRSDIIAVLGLGLALSSNLRIALILCQCRDFIAAIVTIMLAPLTLFGHSFGVARGVITGRQDLSGTRFPSKNQSHIV